MQGQVVDHQRAVVLLTWEIGQGQDAPLQQWAAATLPIVLDHLEMAKALVVAEASGQGARISMQTPAERAPPQRQGSGSPK